MSDENNKSEQCDACGFVMDELEKYTRNIDGEVNWLCKLCAGTMSGNAIDYPNQYPDRSDDILFAICHVGNAIIKEIKKLKK